jgi:hypothetical protein
MPEIDTRSHLDELMALAALYQLALDAVEAVPSIQDWCSSLRVAEDHPFRAGKIVRSTDTGRFTILLASPVTPDMADSVLSAIKWRGFEKEVSALYQPAIFLKHLLLHEIAHGLDSSRSESECDRWAFDQLRFRETN